MGRKYVRTTLACCLVVMAPAAHAQLPQAPETQIADHATRVLQELSGLRVQQIPQNLLGSAEAVAIVPGMIRGAFVVGIQRGRGVLAVKDETGGWTAPQFITITGGSVGWQAGIQATDLVLVFASRRSVQNLLQGTLTVGVDASAAAGPVGRRASAATDLPMQAEIYSYSRSRGLFAGVSLDGSSLQMDPVATGNYYATAAAGTLPPTGQQLLAQLEAFSPPHPALGLPLGQPVYPGGPDAGASAAPRPFPGGVPAAGASLSRGRTPGDRNPAPADAAAMLRAQLSDAMPRLNALLDPRWAVYLRVPEEVTLETLRRTLERYDTVAGDARYAGLSQRSEFQVVRQLLQQLVALAPSGGPLPLPPPPAAR